MSQERLLILLNSLQGWQARNIYPYFLCEETEIWRKNYQNYGLNKENKQIYLFA